MRLVFMGTPSFVVPVLDGLFAAENVQVVGVYTPPDRPRGRGRSPEMPPVKARAIELGLDVYQPESLRSQEVQAELNALKADVFVVAAYGRLLPPPVLESPSHGCLNLHPSLLPRHRGPSPVATAIEEGDTETGVTLMLLDEGMDTGPLVAQRSYPLSSHETADGLTETLFRQGGELLLESLSGWVEGRLEARPQEDALATVTRKLERSDGQADWNVAAAALERRARAFTPWPGLFTQWEGAVIKLLEVSVSPSEAGAGGSPGQVVSLTDGDTPVGVVTSDGVLGLKTLQLEGRRAQPAAEFLRRHPQFIGSQL
ncbi:MAG: methionyl-tRNA formyltransferase [Planctomyces sp.]|nr:methionyl-tRNA formyltransferase [Planctomyces sp.]